MCKTSLLLILLLCATSSYAQVSWNSIGPPSSADRVIALAGDPRNDLVLYLAAPSGGIWKSQNGGVSWKSATDARTPSLEFCSIAVSELAPDTVYAGAGNLYRRSPGGPTGAAQGVVRSTDGGMSWTFLPRFTNRAVCAIAVNPENAAHVLAGSAEGLFLSRDSGNTWKRVLDAAVTSLAFDKSGGVYAGQLSGAPAVRSTDGGATWTELPIPARPGAASAAEWVSVVSNGGAVALAVLRENAAIDFYRATRTEDGGESWAAAFSIGVGSAPLQLISNAFDGNFYIAAKTLLSSANGDHWSSIPTTAANFHAGVFSSGALLLGGDHGLEAAIALRLVQQPPIAQILAVNFDSESAFHVWAAGDTGLFHLSTQPQGIETNRLIPSGGVAVSTVGDPSVYVSGRDEVFTSTDGGATFAPQTVLPAGEPHATYPPIVVDPVNSASIFIAGKNLYRSTNSGETWSFVSQVDPDPTRVVVAMTMAPASRTTLYAATACLDDTPDCTAVSFVWRSVNSGQTWTQVAPVAGVVNRIAVDPRQTNTVYAAVGGAAGDLIRSTNGGVLWTSARGNLPPGAVYDVVIDPASLPAQVTLPAQTVFIGADAGVFVSFDSGTQWMDISASGGAGLPKSPVTALALRATDRTLVAGTYGRGVYWTSLAALSAGLIARNLSLDVALPKQGAANAAISLFNASATTALTWQLSPLDPWISVLTVSDEIRQRSTAEAPIVISAAGLSSGRHVGRLQLAAGSLAQTILVFADVAAEPARITLLGGSPLTGRAGSAITLRVLLEDEEEAPLPDAPVHFAITAGGGSITPATPSTNAAGIASAVLTLPRDPGSLSVVASSGGLSLTIAVTVTPAPSILSDSVIDGVTFNLYTPLAPGSVISISGDNLAETLLPASGPSLPTLLGSTRVRLAAAGGDAVLPLVSVAPNQVRALVPVDFPLGAYRLRVEVAASSSNEIPVTIAATGPGIFTLAGNGRGPGFFYKEDGSLVTAANPADRGSLITFLAAGLGRVSPPVEPGAPGRTAEPFNRTVLAPRVFFDSYAAEVLYSGLAPGVAGRYHITVRVPLLTPASANVSVSLTIGGAASNRVTIPVR